MNYFHWRKPFFKAPKFILEKKKGNHFNFLNRENNSLLDKLYQRFFQLQGRSRHLLSEISA